MFSEQLTPTSALLGTKRNSYAEEARLSLPLSHWGPYLPGSEQNWQCEPWNASAQMQVPFPSRPSMHCDSGKEVISMYKLRWIFYPSPREETMCLSVLLTVTDYQEEPQLWIKNGLLVHSLSFPPWEFRVLTDALLTWPFPEQGLENPPGHGLQSGPKKPLQHFGSCEIK